MPYSLSVVEQADAASRQLNSLLHGIREALAATDVDATTDDKLRGLMVRADEQSRRARALSARSSEELKKKESASHRVQVQWRSKALEAQRCREVAARKEAEAERARQVAEQAQAEASSFETEHLAREREAHLIKTEAARLTEQSRTAEIELAELRFRMKDLQVASRVTAMRGAQYANRVVPVAAIPLRAGSPAAASSIKERPSALSGAGAAAGSSTTKNKQPGPRSARAAAAASPAQERLVPSLPFSTALQPTPAKSSASSHCHRLEVPSPPKQDSVASPGSVMPPVPTHSSISSLSKWTENRRLQYENKISHASALFKHSLQADDTGAHTGVPSDVEAMSMSPPPPNKAGEAQDPRKDHNTLLQDFQQEAHTEQIEIESSRDLVAHDKQMESADAISADPVQESNTDFNDGGEDTAEGGTAVGGSAKASKGRGEGEGRGGRERASSGGGKKRKDKKASRTRKSSLVQDVMASCTNHTFLLQASQKATSAYFDSFFDMSLEAIAAEREAVSTAIPEPPVGDWDMAPRGAAEDEAVYAWREKGEQREARRAAAANGDSFEADEEGGSVETQEEQEEKQQEQEEEEEEEDLFNNTTEGPSAPAVKPGRVTQYGGSLPASLLDAEAECWEEPQLERQHRGSEAESDLRGVSLGLAALKKADCVDDLVDDYHKPKEDTTKSAIAAKAAAATTARGGGGGEAAKAARAAAAAAQAKAAADMARLDSLSEAHGAILGHFTGDVPHALMGLEFGDSKQEEAGEGAAGAERRGKEKKKGTDKKRKKTKSRRGSEGVTADASRHLASEGGEDLGVGEVKKGGVVAGGLSEEPLPLAGEKDFVKPPSIFDVQNEGLAGGLLGGQEVSGSEEVARDSHARPGKLRVKFNVVGHMAKEMAEAMACVEGGSERGGIRNESPKGMPVGVGRREGGREREKWDGHVTHVGGDNNPAHSPVNQERRKKKHKKKGRSS